MDTVVDAMFVIRTPVSVLIMEGTRSRRIITQDVLQDDANKRSRLC
jgi:hypothetical protein